MLRPTHRRRRADCNNRRRYHRRRKTFNDDKKFVRKMFFSRITSMNRRCSREFGLETERSTVIGFGYTRVRDSVQGDVPNRKSNIILLYLIKLLYNYYYCFQVFTYKSSADETVFTGQ